EGFRTEEVEQSMYRMDSLKAAYEEVLRGPRKEIIEKQKQKVNASFAKLNELNSKVKELEVKSPCDCELAEFDNQVGDLIAANQVLGVLIDISDVWVEVYLPEKLYGKVWPGDKVKVSSYAHAQSAFNKSNLTGTVSYVALKSEYTPRNIQTIEGRLEQVFKVKIKLNNRQKLFRPGMDLEMNFDFNKSKPKEASK
ncbi:MAG TPA: HlyD family secretion protein, partial [Vampirovibrionales bacterium]